MTDEIARRLATLSVNQRMLFEARLRDLRRQPAAASPVDASGMSSSAQSGQAVGTESCGPTRAMSFSVFFFSDDGATVDDRKYHMLLECARYADRNGFEAIWTPERHFQIFGGLYPNPAVLSAALAMITERIAIRAGSVVLPLHHPMRVAEEWSLVDNLSSGRVGLAVASGWHPDDFTLMPAAYARRHEVALASIETLRLLWRGGALEQRNGKDETVALRIYPKPIQPQLPIWLTAMSARSFVEAGRIGINVLTGLMDQDLDECSRRIVSYRKSLLDNGFDPEAGRVTVMMHTYIDRDMDSVRRLVREPMLNYIRTFLRASESQLRSDPRIKAVFAADREDDRQVVIQHAFERYVGGCSLLGTLESCRARVARLAAMGVNEIACLLDFGLDAPTVLAGLGRLNALRAANAERHQTGAAQ